MDKAAFNRRNFHKYTFCAWKAADMTAVSALKPDYKSKSGSTYYFTDAGVYRCSDHWARVANCKWRLEGVSGHGNRLGYAEWKDFHPDNEVEKLYYISVDFIKKTATYEHVGSLPENRAALLRNAPETMKRIREIRKFLETDSWLTYYDGDPEKIREQVVNALADSDASPASIRTGILPKR